MYTVSNPCKSRRVIYDNKGQMVVFDRGQTRENVDLSDKLVERMAKRREQGIVDLEIVGSGEKTELQRKEEKRAVDAPKGTPGETTGKRQARERLAEGKAARASAEEQAAAAAEDRGEDPDDSAQQAQDLLDQADAMDYADFKSEAKEVLGDDWPGGNPAKAEIVELLQERTAASGRVRLRG